jgi:hypothetical protein
MRVRRWFFGHYGVQVTTFSLRCLAPRALTRVQIADTIFSASSYDGGRDQSRENY